MDEPVVQATDNSTYLDKRSDGGHEPYMGTVFMDTDNKKDFSVRFNLVYLVMLVVVNWGSSCLMMNYYSRQDYFDEHPYVVIESLLEKVLL